MGRDDAILPSPYSAKTSRGRKPMRLQDREVLPETGEPARIRLWREVPGGTGTRSACRFTWKKRGHQGPSCPSHTGANEAAKATPLLRSRTTPCLHLPHVARRRPEALCTPDLLDEPGIATIPPGFREIFPHMSGLTPQRRVEYSRSKRVFVSSSGLGFHDAVFLGFALAWDLQSRSVVFSVGLP